MPSNAETKVRERLANNGRNAANKNAGIRVGSDLHLCEMLLVEIDELRKNLRRFAVRQHVRMASGGGTVPSGGSCEVCKTEWSEGQPESHRASCLLARVPG